MKIYLTKEEMPTHYYNIVADMVEAGYNEKEITHIEKRLDS